MIATVAVVFGLTPTAEYLPEGQEPKAFTRMIAPPGYSLAAMTSIADQVRQTQIDSDPSLVLIPGAGSELYRGVGVIVLNGLLCSTIVTLSFLSCLLVKLLEWPPFRRRMIASDHPQPRSSR